MPRYYVVSCLILSGKRSSITNEVLFSKAFNWLPRVMAISGGNVFAVSCREISIGMYTCVQYVDDAVVYVGDAVYY